MDIELKYGEGRKTIYIPDKADVSILEPSAMPPVASIAEAVKGALASPRAGPSFSDHLLRVNPSSVVIVVPDETRPTPLQQILPPLLDVLFAELPGLAQEAVTILIGGGLHPPLDPAAAGRLVPPVIAGDARIRSHDAIHSALVDFGRTSRGTSVRINARFSRSDFKIVVGQIDPHQFVGFTGGSKGVVIGCGGAETIEHNHSLMFDDNAQVGRLHGNPVREDLNEAGLMAGIDLALNCVLDADKRVVQMLSGPPLDVLEAGADTCARLYGVAIEEKFDIVVASCGGYPKDICLYQAQKGLNLASQAVKKNGHILLLAASPQGVGDDIYFDYVSQFTTPEEVLHDFRKIGFKMGAHKAYLFGRTLARYNVAVFSDLDPGILRKCHLQAADPSRIVSEWVNAMERPPRIGVIPNANTTYFYASES
ncbi:MAG: nickel-dependent lactate racemase [Desulfobacterales bacterium]